MLPDPERARLRRPAVLAGQRETAADPRLRDLGLTAHLVPEPDRWADSVVARAEAGSVLVQPTLHLVHGMGATWPAASKAPLPEPDADWREWPEWMSGRDPSYPPPPPEFEESRTRFDASHARAILCYEARTGRDVTGELRRRFEAAAAGSARLVYGAMLLTLGEHRPDPATVSARFRSGSEAERSLAVREITRLFAGSPATADPATAAPLVDRASSPW